ncbi:uncharacterized protein BO80DRAFT_433726 [Aspergillus ibericus CBS 121593]|uniref:Integral membrane protein n=1 Tax=Aspergillus ibericus CBS 121593 TaxID=1448316 RepID=A0A395H6H7_9EURO|nr:hypothetical protein BO80DRAFT_433726 [Aspergillus ibericus CBS 121593]RAL02468.1 hypothetical protein BO80DRAFT_433726 [Aspergillus ibericus CBS 121593]
MVFYLSLMSLVLSTVARAHSVALLPSAASSSFPSCGLTCSVLKEAQDHCLPPVAPETDSATYLSCFCQSNLLTQIHSPTGVCTESCTSASDRSLIRTWYDELCSSESTLSERDMSASIFPRDSRSQAWWTTHYQWVIMIIVLVVAFSVITVVGIWLKRRHDRKYPGLYHAAGTAGTDSALLAARQQDASPSPGPGPPAQGAFRPGRYDTATNSESIASSSRTNVAAPTTRPGRTPSRLQKTQPVPEGDIEIREVAR